MATRLMMGRKRLRQDQRGVVLVMAVPGFVLAVVCLALSVDIGRQVLEKRRDQSVADMASLDAARAVAKLPTTASATARSTAAQAAAVAAAARNGFVSTPAAPVVATVGSVDPLDNVFKPVGFSAVEVSLTSTIDYIFMPGTKTLSARAVASVTPQASFSVGSTLASLDAKKPLLDPILAGMLGLGASDLSLVSYDGLASSSVTLGALQTQLLALGLDVGTTEKLMSTEIKVSELLTATAQALTQQGDSAAAAEVNKIPIASPDTDTVKIEDLVTVSQPGSNSALDTGVNVFPLLTGSAQVANGASFVDVPLAGIDLLGLTGVTMKLKVIEPPKIASGPVGTKAANSQVTLRVTVNVPLGPLLPVAVVSLDYTSANAEAELTEIRCPPGPGIAITAGTSGMSVVGTGTVPLGTLDILGSVAGTPSTALPFFDHPARFTPYTHRVGAATLGLNLATLSVTGSGAAAPLAPTLQAALPLTLTTLNTALSPVIQPLLASLGANVASADVQALDILPSPTSCAGNLRLVQ